jgi:hypothetical protein
MGDWPMVGWSGDCSMKNLNIKLDESGLLHFICDPTAKVGYSKKLATVAQSTGWQDIELPDGSVLRVNLYVGRSRTLAEEAEYQASPKEVSSSRSPIKIG